MGWWSHFINEGSLALIALALFVAQVLARELGSLTHRLVVGATDDPPEEASDKGFIQSGVLGLLALLIAFTFGMAVNRYETRRDMVVAEANALGTAEMRVQLLEAPQGAQLAQMLHAYARTRLAYGLAGAGDKPALVESSAKQRTALQTATLSALVPVRTTPLAPFVGAAINSVLDVGAEREATLSATLPVTILAALVVYILLTAGVLGYSLTGVRSRHRVATGIVFALLTMAILLILDLDRPQGGTIRTDQTPMSQLVAGFPPAGG